MDIRIKTRERLLTSPEGEIYLVRDVWVNHLLSVQNGVADEHGDISWTTVPEACPFDRLTPLNLNLKAA